MARRLRRPVQAAVIATALVAMGAAAGGGWSFYRDLDSTDDALFHRYRAPEDVELSHDEMVAAMRVVEEALGAATAPGDGETAGAPHGVHVTIWGDAPEPIRGQGDGGPLSASLEQATLAALESADDPASFGPDRARIQIDVLHQPVPIRRRPLHGLRIRVIGQRSDLPLGEFDGSPLERQLVYEIEPGVHGIRLDGDGKHGVILPADPVTHGWLTPREKGRDRKLRVMLRHLGEGAGGDQDLWKQPGVKLERFRTLCFGRPVPGGEVIPLLRANVPRSGPVDAAAIVEGIDQGTRWLAGRIQPDGSFDYEAFPNSDTGSDDYNAVRHAGCVVGLYELYRSASTEDRLGPGAGALLDAALQGQGWIDAHLRPPPGAADETLLALVDDDGWAQAGASGFALLGLLDRPRLDDDPQDDRERIEALGRFLLEMIDDQGRVYLRYGHKTRHDQVQTEHPWFPGIALLALTRTYQETGDERWLDGARRIADQRVSSYLAVGNTPCHWTMQGLWELYRTTGEERYARANLAMADHYVSEQFPPHEPPFPDYLGGFRRNDDVPRTIRAASRCEALGAAVHTARELGVDATVYEEALLAAAGHLMDNQFRPANSYYLPAPERVRGAMRLGLVDNHCRVDANKHMTRGLWAALRVLRTREQESGARSGSP